MVTATPQKPTGTSTPRTEELTGEYSRTCFSRDNFLIGVLRDGTGIKGSADPAKLIPGGSYRFIGKWENHPQYGRQFRFQTFVESEPHTYNGVIQYLLRNTERVGIGRATAHAIIDAFGADKAVGILKRNPEAVHKAIPRLKMELLRAASQQLIAVERFEQTKIDLLDLLAGRGFHGDIIDACVRRFGVLGPQRIRHDPYTLLVNKMPGCGFLRVDSLYQELGLPLDRLKRQTICVWHAMRSDMSGSVWFKRAWVETRVRELVSGELKIDKAIALGVRARMLEVKVVDGVEWLASAQDARDERLVSEYLRRIVEGGKRDDAAEWPDVSFIPADDSITPHQREQLAIATSGSVGCLTGLPGTGKSFSLARLVGLLPLNKVALCAPTGRAAVRIMEAMSEYGYDLHAQTIHSLLGPSRNGHDREGWGFIHNEHNPLPFDYIICDEGSMPNNNILASLFSAIKPGACLLMLGDPNQLPPVGAGRPFIDMIDAGLPHGHLNEVHRYAGRIATVCKAINDGERWEPSKEINIEDGVDYPENLRHIERSNPAIQIETLKVVVERIVNKRGFDPIWDMQVLCAVNEKTAVCRKKLNVVLQALLNQDGERMERNPFRVGDKVMCLKNGWRAEHWEGEKPHCLSEWYIANGEIGCVRQISEHWIAVQFLGKDEWIRFERAEWSEIDLAYAVTVHKAQGAGFPVVVVMIDGSAGANFICSRSHHYTAISRSSKLCITIGKKSVLDAHCRRVDTDGRVTFLRKEIEGWIH
jgi:exodeoxyribonuclease V alpha subunit